MFKLIFCLFVVVSVYYYGWAVEDYTEFYKVQLRVLFVAHYTYQHMPCLVAIVVCAHVHHVVHYPIISIYPCAGPAVVYFKDLFKVSQELNQAAELSPGHSFF